MWFCDCKDSKTLSPVEGDLAGKHVDGLPRGPSAGVQKKCHLCGPPAGPGFITVASWHQCPTTWAQALTGGVISGTALNSYLPPLPQL